MFNRIKSWLKMRSDQKQWESQERNQAYRLLGLYNAIQLTVDSLSEADRHNIAELMLNPAYVSMLKLHNTLKANWLQGLHLKRIKPGMEEVYRGGVMMLDLVEQVCLAELKNQRESQNENRQNEVLNGLGW